MNAEDKQIIQLNELLQQKLAEIEELQEKIGRLYVGILFSFAGGWLLAVFGLK